MTRLIVPLAVLCGGSFAQAQTTDSIVFGITKQLNYVQTSANAPVLDATQAAKFEAGLAPNVAGSVRTPAGATSAIPANDSFSRTFASRAAMDAAFPDGTYTLTGGTTSITLAVSGSYIPVDIPRVTNGTWAQNRLVLDPARENIIILNPFTGYGTAGLWANAYFSLWEGDGDDIVSVGSFSTQQPTLSSSVTIPAGKLVAGHTYNVEVGWYIAGAQNTTAFPGMFAGAAGGNQLTFQISAVTAAPAALAFTTQPVSQTIAAGNTVVFSAAASGSPTPTYQWRRGTANIAGATSSTLVLTGAEASAGSYTVVATNSSGSGTSAAGTLTVNAVAAAQVGRLVNLAIRTGAGTGAQTLIVGLATGGAGTTGSKELLIRAIGPSLAQFNLTGTLADPTATVFQGSTSIATNDNWGGDALVTARATQVAAFGLTSTASLDSALALSPVAGPYTVQIAGKNNATGLVLAEIYDASANASFTAATPRLVNVSARTQVGTGGDILIAGFVIGGTTSKTVLIRAIGPTLGAFGVTGTLADPRLQLFSGSTVLRENDNWGGDAQLTATGSSVGAFALSDAASKDAMLLITLPPGSYTAQVSGVANTTGVVLVEVYEVP